MVNQYIEQRSNLSQKTVLITGCSSGIGWATAKNSDLQVGGYLQLQEGQKIYLES